MPIKVKSMIAVGAAMLAGACASIPPVAQSSPPVAESSPPAAQSTPPAPVGNWVPVGDRALPAAELNYAPAFPGNDAISFAAAYGERATGGHGTFARFPANFETPVHTHTHAYRAIVLKGVMTNPFQGEASPKRLTPGSYWEVSAGSVHTTACVSSTPCEFYMYGDAAFDFIPGGGE